MATHSALMVLQLTRMQPDLCYCIHAVDLRIGRLLLRCSSRRMGAARVCVCMTQSHYRPSNCTTLRTLFLCLLTAAEIKTS